MKDREVAIPRQLDDLGPVDRVWAVCNSMPNASRAAMLAACKELKVNENTAATHIQLWRTSRRRSKEAKALPPRLRQRITRVVKEAEARQ